MALSASFTAHAPRQSDTQLTGWVGLMLTLFEPLPTGFTVLPLPDKNSYTSRFTGLLNSTMGLRQWHKSAILRRLLKKSVCRAEQRG